MAIWKQGAGWNKGLRRWLAVGLLAWLAGCGSDAASQVDASATDSAQDAAVADVAVDVKPQDISKDTAQDAAAADSKVADSQVTDSAAADSAFPADTASSDTGSSDTASSDTASSGDSSDASVADAPAPDSAAADSTSVDAVADTDPGIACAKAVIASGEFKDHYLELAAAPTTTQGLKATTWTWTAQQPFGKAVFAPDAASAKVKLGPVLYQGSYTVCLQVETAGQPACAPTCQTYVYTPGLYVELKWQTPAASDPVGASAADLNLHLADEKATSNKDLDCDNQPDPWYDEQNAAFWLNPTPDWGQAGSLADDPLVDDAANPSKPEVILVDLPATGTYSLAVHVLNDKLAGASIAELSVYAAGVQLVQLSGVSLKQSDLWTVGKLIVPGGGAPAQWVACSQSADACKGGGKLWQSSGDLCTTPCYEYAGLFSKATPACGWKWQ